MEVNCLECGKNYDSQLKICPYCGYENKKMKINKMIHIILIVSSIFFISLSVKSVFSGISNNELNEYFEMYGSAKTGTIAYYLDKMRFWTMSIWIVGIWIGCYIKKKNRLIGEIIKNVSISLFIITQFLPLGYALYIR